MISKKIARPLLALTTATALTFGLAGCFSNPVDGVIEGVVEEQTGVDVGATGGANLPADWPAEIPLPDGQVQYAIAAGGDFNLGIAVSDEDAARAGLEALKAAGYTVTSEGTLPDGETFTLENSKWTIGYLWGLNEDKTAVVSVSVVTN
jgi:catechol 2,3-dioxygenase-like lactoylglutathione lyase family enzyme